MGHARDAGARPADPQQRPAPGRRRPDAVAGTEPLHPRRHHRAGSRTSSRPTASVPAMPTTTCCTSSPAKSRRRRAGRRTKQLVRREIFEPLGLSRCRVGAFEPRCGRQRRATARCRDGRAQRRQCATMAQVPAITIGRGRWHPLQPRRHAALGAQLAAAGRAAAGMAVAANNARDMWLPRTPMPISARRRAWDNTHAYAYGYGFRMADVDGAWTVSHTGTLSGMYSVMTLLPDKRSGFVVLINGDGGRSAHRVERSAGQALHRAGAGAHRRRIRRTHRRETLHRRTASRCRTLRRACLRRRRIWRRGSGYWRDPWFGEATLCARRRYGALHAQRSRRMLHGQVMRVGERYLIDWDGDDLEAWLDFAGSGDGRPIDDAGQGPIPTATSATTTKTWHSRRVGDCDSTRACRPRERRRKPAWSTSPRWCPTSRSTSAMPAATTSSARRSMATTHRMLSARRAAAQALQRVEEALRKDGLRLKIFDCYRPARAVQHFVRWAGDLADQRTKPRYYPNLDKRTLLGDYIAPVSGHSRGATVDLTLLRLRPRAIAASRSTWAPTSISSTRGRTPTRRASRAQQRANRAAPAGGDVGAGLRATTRTSGGTTRLHPSTSRSRERLSSMTFPSSSGAPSKRDHCRTRRRSIATCIFPPSCSPPPACSAGCATGAERMQHAQIDRLMDRYAGAVPGASLLVIHDGVDVIRRGYGLADLEEGSRSRPGDQLPAGVHHQAVHRRRDPVAGGGRAPAAGRSCCARGCPRCRPPPMRSPSATC